MTWLTDEDREFQKRFNMNDSTPRYNFRFKDKEGNQFTVYLKNGTAEEWAEKHKVKFLGKA